MYDRYDSAGWSGGWIDAPENQAHSDVFDAVRQLDHNQRSRLSKFMQFLQAYLNRPITSLGGKNYTSADDENYDNLVHNVGKNLVNAATSKISTKKVKVMFLTMGGSPQMKKKAELLNKL